MRRLELLIVAAALALAACGNSKPPGEATKIAATLSGDAKGNAAANPRCAMFSNDEIAALAGEPVKDGGNAAGGLGCQWLNAGGSGSTIFTVAPASNHVETSEAPGYRPLPGVGSKGFVAGKPGAWSAAAIDGDNMVSVSIDGSRATETNTVALLKAAIAKGKG